MWDEPALAWRAGPPPGAATYARWLDAGARSTSALRSWAVTLLAAAAAGPWAVLGAFFAGSPLGQGAMSLLVVGPTVEEMMKIGAAAVIVERRPFLFRSRAQILLCALAGGLVFAAIENLLYLHVYLEDPDPWLARWRWTVCVALHAGCSVIAGLGVARAWSQTMRERRAADLGAGLWMLGAAIVLHGAYNGAAMAWGL